MSTNMHAEKKVLTRTSKLLKEFRQFAIKGNFIELAVAVVIGAAGGRVVTSLVSDIITPPLSLLLGKVNFANLFITLSGGHYAVLDDARKAGAVTVNYGAFISTLIDFTCVTFVVFLVIRLVNRLRAEPQPKPPDTRECPQCLSAVKIGAKRCPFCTSELAQ